MKGIKGDMGDPGVSGAEVSVRTSILSKQFSCLIVIKYCIILIIITSVTLIYITVLLERVNSDIVFKSQGRPGAKGEQGLTVSSSIQLMFELYIYY